ncbi:MAG: MFS transporter [Oscillospiraceae bacterium]|nr:MFS transporter [Oscillospiraceae bacterium]
MAFTYKHTRAACRLGNVCLALTNNLPPLLFIIFRTDYGLSYEQLGRLVLLNFAIQIAVDFACAKYIDRIGYRRPMMLAYACCTAGFLTLAGAPMLPIPIYPALAAGVMIAAVGGGLQEVMLSPISDALPAQTEKKAANMALLHSFYCWGWMGVVLLSTLFLAAFGNARWQVLAVLWTALPVTNFILFAKVPYAPALPHDNLMGVKKLFITPIFWVAMVLMVCAGASELAVAQWVSLFAEQGLGLSKLAGDLAGPMMFAVTMGIGRTLYGIFGDKIKLMPALAASAALCVISYFIIAFAPRPAFSLVGCALVGFAISLMWPGLLSLTAAKLPMGGTAMFAVLAMSGGAGCAAGPWLTGFVADLSQKSGTVGEVGAAILGHGESGLKLGILAAVIFPAAMLAILPLFGRKSAI